MAFSHVSDSEHEAEDAISLADHCVSGEEQCLCSLPGPGHFGEDDASEVGLDHYSHYCFEAHEEYRFGAFFCGRSSAITWGGKICLVSVAF